MLFGIKTVLTKYLKEKKIFPFTQDYIQKMVSLYRSLLVPTRIMLKASNIVMQLTLYGAGCIAALFYSVWVFRLILTKGPRRVFQKIKRLPPKILTDSCYGEHKYLTLKVSLLK